VPGAVLTGLLDAVGVMPGALDDAEIRALAPLVQVLQAGDICDDAFKRPLLIRGGQIIDPAADDADGPLEFHPVGIDARSGRGGADQRAYSVVREQVAQISCLPCPVTGTAGSSPGRGDGA
jgi:hypothetical protein